ncbi:protein kinase domain protein [Ichthyophthirius multifiliis]|uniref:Protein kinase domain protein n=1 Tax=Ichthyophthirius multifiliis TaxID=5932 RepID=G0QKN7_ICHMU|nr:protein kinase domain protein [Ichthyophthirius multifiliis]EGR34221.1 protein kinase domain protein [Ichthyophthirius multifiliis]|eukprot:XP_004039525.1 protein kinase domain protein [Ichthyophthirius multifiliis]
MQNKYKYIYIYIYIYIIYIYIYIYIYLYLYIYLYIFLQQPYIIFLKQIFILKQNKMGQITSILNDQEIENQDDQKFRNQTIDYQEIYDKILQKFYVSNSNYKSNFYQTVQILTCKYNKIFTLYLKEIILNLDEKYEIQKGYWQARYTDIQHLNLIQLHGVSGNKIETFCSTFYQICLLFDSIQNNLEEQLILYKTYTEEQLWFILDSLVSALEYLQEREIEHQALNLQTIFITYNHKNIKLYKLSDPQLFDLQSNYSNLLLGHKNNCFYLSPVLFQQLQQKVQKPVHNSYKSDVFTLGMIILQLALGKNIQDIYNNGIFNEEILYQKLKSLNGIYKKEFIDIITQMCDVYEERRPDFRILDRQLSQCMTLFGKRICERLKVTNLAFLKINIDFKNDEQITFEQEQQKKKEIERKENEKKMIIQAIQNQEAIQIIKQSLEKTQKINQQFLLQNKQTEIQFNINCKGNKQIINQDIIYEQSNYVTQSDFNSNKIDKNNNDGFIKQYQVPNNKFQMKIYQDNPELEQIVQKYINKQ